ncbi:transcriptional regulator [Candidatus Saccharibacteria bacterium]|nr:transcriptional regulator [Candidatus Saccharibacteria bacterium]
MVEQLFGSKTRVKLLRLFYSNPNRSFYVREITRKIDEQINSVRRELSNLLSIGIISSDTTNNRLYYEVNQSYEFYQPLGLIFGGVELPAEAKDEVAPPPKAQSKDPMLVELSQIGNIELAIYTGQFTRDETSGIDMLIVGDVNQTKLQKFMQLLEEQEKKEVRYVVMGISEFTYRRQVKDRFITTVLAAKNQVLIDKKQLVEEE